VADALETLETMDNREVTKLRRVVVPGPNVQGLPPHSVEAEQGVLGSILSQASLRPSLPPVEILECQEHIGPDYFYVPANRMIWEVLCEMFEKKKALDFITVTQELRDRNLLDGVGGPSYVTDLFAFVPSAANIEYYLDIMRDKYVLREIIACCTEAIRRAYDEQDDVPGLLDEVQEKVTAIALRKLGDSPLKHIKDDVYAVIEEFENAKKHKGRTQGLATGFKDYDRMTSGLGAGEMIVLAARPSMGKTAFAMNIAEYVACARVEREKWNYAGAPVAVFSLETSRHRLVRRMLCGKSHISLQRLRDGFLEDEDIAKITEAASKLGAAPIYIDESPSLRIFDFKARSRYAVVKLGVKLIVIDYVQLMTTGGKPASSPYDRAIELTRISQSIKQVSRELDVPIIAIAQLNREAEKNASGKPRMSNLRECGAFEQDADLVALLWREEYYITDEKEKAEVEGEAELIVAKQKDGPVGDIKLTFLKEYTRFENRTSDLYSNNPEERQEGFQE
jgi:replicative DNA helicase